MKSREVLIDIPERELEIIMSLNQKNVRYLIVGGYAMLFHGNGDRWVNDLDIWIDNEKENAHRCFEALQAVMSGSLQFTPECLSVRGRKIDLRGACYDAEVLTSIEGVEFNESFMRRGTFVQNGVLICFIGALDLLRVKKKAYDSYSDRVEKEGRDIAFLESITNT
jgi:hypothetical protein